MSDSESSELSLSESEEADLASSFFEAALFVVFLGFGCAGFVALAFFFRGVVAFSGLATSGAWGALGAACTVKPIPKSSLREWRWRLTFRAWSCGDGHNYLRNCAWY